MECGVGGEAGGEVEVGAKEEVDLGDDEAGDWLRSEEDAAAFARGGGVGVEEGLE